MLVDAHQHYWQPARGDYGWLVPAMTGLYRDFLPADLAPALAAAGVDATVLVQAAPTTAETRFLLALAERTPSVAGVVGWAALDASDAPRQIDELVAAGGGLLKGLRPMLQDLPDPAWILDRLLDPAFAAIEAQALAFDALVQPHHLGHLLRRLERQPELRVVIDHCGKPDLAGGDSSAWAQGMRDLARNTSAHCKLSGLLTQLGPEQNLDAARACVDLVFAEFGHERILWGSDWPVLLLRGDYAQWLQWCSRRLEGLEAAARAAVLGGNAVRFYHLRRPSGGAGTLQGS